MLENNARCITFVTTYVKMSITLVTTYVKMYAHFICGITLQWRYNKQIIYENTVADVWNLF